VPWVFRVDKDVKQGKKGGGSEKQLKIRGIKEHAKIDDNFSSWPPVALPLLGTLPIDI
jgi:hypothetical protein